MNAREFYDLTKAMRVAQKNFFAAKDKQEKQNWYAVRGTCSCWESQQAAMKMNRSKDGRPICTRRNAIRAMISATA